MPYPYGTLSLLKENRSRSQEIYYDDDTHFPSQCQDLHDAKVYSIHSIWQIVKVKEI